MATEHEVAGSEETGRQTVIDLIRKGEPLEVRQLLDRFTLKELIEHSAQDKSFFGAYLFYFGMLTLRRHKTKAKTVELVVPNEVMHGLYVERIRRILMGFERLVFRSNPKAQAFVRREYRKGWDFSAL